MTTMEDMPLRIGHSRLPGGSELQSEPCTGSLRLRGSVKKRRVDGPQLPIFILRGNGTGGSGSAIDRA